MLGDAVACTVIAFSLQNMVLRVRSHLLLWVVQREGRTREASKRCAGVCNLKRVIPPFLSFSRGAGVAAEQ